MSSYTFRYADEAPCPDVTPEMLSHLTHAAQVALGTSDANERRTAESQLLLLSAYDNWDITRTVFRLSTDNYLRFVAAKGILFIVRNELGPAERVDVQHFVLNYLRERSNAGERLPRYLLNIIYNIFASAAFNNWKIQIIKRSNMTNGGDAIEGEEQLEATGVAMVKLMQHYLPAEEVMNCMSEVVGYFGQEVKKTHLEYILPLFVKDILLCFFSVVASELNNLPDQALQLCVLVLESVPNLAGGLDFRLTSDKTITLMEWYLWKDPLFLVLDYTCNVVVNMPQSPLAWQCSRLIRLCSLISSAEEQFIITRDEFYLKFVSFSESIVLRPDSPDRLELACAVLVNIFERAADVMIDYFQRFPQAITSWVQATMNIVREYNDDEEELRQQLLHLCYLLAERLLPRGTHFMDSLEDYIYDTGRGELVYRPRGMEAAQGPLDEQNSAMLSEGILMVFNLYFNTVMKKAHLQEDSEELRTDVGLYLHNERTLSPLSELLFTDKVELLPIVTERLTRCIYQYAECMKVRNSGGGNQSTIEELVNLIVEERESEESKALLTQLYREPPASMVLLLSHVCLSRLSVIISTIAIAAHNGTMRDLNVFNIIAQFGQQLFTPEDDVTLSLLECMDLLENSPGGKEENPQNNRPKLHQGILRSFFFFSTCVYESEHARQTPFYEITLNLLRFVILYHADIPVLLMDANVLLHRMLKGGVGVSFIGSDKLYAIIKAVKTNSVRLPGADSGPRGLEARSKFLTVFTEAAEIRYYAGYAVDNVIDTLIGQILHGNNLQRNPDQALQDALSVTEGCRQPDTLHCILEGLLEHASTVGETLMSSTSLLLDWLARLCELSGKYLDNGHRNPINWQLANFVMSCLNRFFNAAAVSTGGNKFTFATDSVREDIVYSVSSVLYSLSSSSWCNIGVIMYYQRASVESFFLGAVQVLLSVSPSLLMSSKEGQKKVFDAILSALSGVGATFDLLNALFLRHNIWESLLQYLCRCLSYNFSSDVLTIMHRITFNDDQRRGDGPSEQISRATFGRAYQEVVMQIVTVPYIEKRDMNNAFGILTHCFNAAPQECEIVTQKLLSFSAAYHRVRIRMILNTFQQDRSTDCMSAYLNVFGLTSGVPSLTAW
ncbi:hypothetical protein AGDE_09898 [Angomonas deanei]|uniref:Uncharacterized protein n=1 Tax=Angomonas deanei TaxID=59799 RepID=A0A7G2CSA5_9TRYP|nr:hypothetical protein AGDE_09898 [Angomonas deanei]CAD2222249.1 hypothetical protein, conserved [Angomonas deanei]|eukprot:EPY29713.1 hypothetical protein AGDE_09898 [Angomonas deanei]